MNISSMLRSSVLGIAVCVGVLSLGAAPSSAAVHDIYANPDSAKGDLAAALENARATHRRVILDFGGNWCPDCHVLDSYFHDEINKPLLEANFVLVHVNIGRRDVNLDIASDYHVPLGKGVPALAVLDTDGKLLYSQAGGEFEDMRHMQSSDVTAFLKKWTPTATAPTASMPTASMPTVPEPTAPEPAASMAVVK